MTGGMPLRQTGSHPRPSDRRVAASIKKTARNEQFLLLYSFKYIALPSMHILGGEGMINNGKKMLMK